MHILDALFFVTTGKTSTDLSDSLSAQKILADLRHCIMEGVRQQVVQASAPYLILLFQNQSKDWYSIE